ncbi:hypothetical protein GCM10009096_16840 [Parasphingorhabdus litoris]|uniref:Uncharacterized protein n=1 Tax=Parasphingorhabdus litoris TaxID=394733 RepID=A0ABN1AGA9_9SPHN
MAGPIGNKKAMMTAVLLRKQEPRVLVDKVAVTAPVCGLCGNANLPGLRIRVTQGHTPQSGKIFAPEKA